MRAGTYLLLGLAVLVVILSKIPMLVAYQLTPARFQWTGILSRNTADFNSYLSIVEETRHSSFRARNLYSSEPHKPFQIRPLHNFLGLIGRILPSVSSLALLNAAGILTTLGLAIVLLWLSCRMFSETYERVICFLILCLGSGLGWLHLVSDPPDLRIVETSTFLTFLSPPLYQVSLGLLIVIFLLIDRSWNSFPSALCAIWLGLERPFSLAPITIAILGTLIIQNRNRFFPAFLKILPFLVSIGLVLGYQMLLMRSIPVYASWNRQHVLPTPEPLRMFSSIGLLLPLGIIGVRSTIRKMPVLGCFFLIYMVASISLAYMPFPYQERFLEGFPVSVAVFASEGLILLLRKFRSATLRTAFAAVTLALLMPSNFYGFRSDLEVVAHQSAPQFLPVHLVDAMRKLQQLAKPDEAVLCTQQIGNFIAAYAARPVFIGHNVATAGIQKKRLLVNQLFRTPANTAQAKKLFEVSKTTWLFWSPEEKVLSGGKFNPADAPYLKLQFSNELAQIYRFKPSN